MMLDALATFSDVQSLAAAAGNVLSTGSYDLGPTTNVDSKGNTVISDAGRSQLDLFVQLIAAVTSGGAATIDFQLVSADDGPLTTNITVLQSTGAMALAAMTAGKMIRLSLPVGITQRYIGLRYVIATATTTGGTITAALINHKFARPTNPTV